MSKGSNCRHCKESIAAGATVCKTCGHEQNSFVYWIKQIGTPVGLLATVVGLLATVVSVGISTAAFIEASREPVPQAKLAITSFRVDDAEARLTLEVLNYGTAPTTVRTVLISQNFAYSIGGRDRYSGSIPVQEHDSIPPGEYKDIQLDLEMFSSREGWSGSLRHSALPHDVRVKWPQEVGFNTISWETKVDCRMTLLTSGVNGQFDSGIVNIEGSIAICELIEAYAISHFSSNGMFYER